MGDGRVAGKHRVWAKERRCDLSTRWRYSAVKPQAHRSGRARVARRRGGVGALTVAVAAEFGPDRFAEVVSGSGVVGKRFQEGFEIGGDVSRRRGR